MNRKQYVEQVLTETIGLDLESMGIGFLDRIEKLFKKELEQKNTGKLNSWTLSSEEEKRLIQAAVVPETWFFRDREPFRYLQIYLKELKKTIGKEKKISILSAPCSSGEEPYSIAITFLEAGFSPKDFIIDALDINETVLTIARRGVYGNRSFRNMDIEKQRRYFRKKGEEFHLHDSVITTVRFLCANLLRMNVSALQPNYDVIFCRNLLIYLNKKARAKILSLISKILRPGGMLVVGHAELLFWQSQGYLPVNHAHSFSLIKPDLNQYKESIVTEQLKTGVYKTSCNRMAGHKQSLIIKEEIGQSRSMLAKRQDIDNVLFKNKESSNVNSVVSNTGEDITSLECLLSQARNLANCGDLKAALIACRTYLQTENPCADIYCLMGLIYDAGNHLNEAEDCYRRALYLDPHHIETLTHAALFYERLNEIDKASLYWEREKRAKTNQI